MVASPPARGLAKGSIARHTRSVKGEIGDEADGSMEDNEFLANTVPCKALSPKTLPFDDDKQMFKAN
ncbi:hypothetical protein KIN20_016703 [Parelaphostrongylus tenuis]|uniref:Uncharacterized protein n=1 Tax=Parelaphostrongylus tenuis TaxID=148309 RepID=A0AAD5QTC0_PARTN|nr:hypothetical protein KIN20_016703 [Parelaphostrongylus tenuis]